MDGGEKGRTSANGKGDIRARKVKDGPESTNVGKEKGYNFKNSSYRRHKQGICSQEGLPYQNLQQETTLEHCQGSPLLLHGSVCPLRRRGIHHEQRPGCRPIDLVFTTNHRSNGSRRL
ncbi:hypothetical protein GEMRC1_010624 [Eukaryota sp. GEM-RC1]